MITDRRKTEMNNPMSMIDIGKIQPQARELEAAVLGALMIEKEAFGLIDGIISEDDFYDIIHQTIFKAISNLGGKRNPIDMITVVEELKKMGEIENIGGVAYIAELTDKVMSSAHIEFHAKIISQKAQARKLIAVSATIQNMAFDETQDVAETIEVLEKSLTELTANNSPCQSLDIEAALTKTLNQAVKLQEDKSKGLLTAIPTHLKQLTEQLDGGWRDPDLIIIGARPSMGKTQHAIAAAKSAALSNIDCALFSLEMTAVQIINRLLMEDEAIDGYNLRTGQMKPEEWIAIDGMVNNLLSMKLNIADHHNIRYLNNIKSEARRLHRQGRLKLLIIDYLQLIRTNMKFGTRDLEIGYITGELKNLAKELGIPVIVLSQLSRKEKGVKVKDPQLEDLRESGNIEQDADIVIFIHKPDYYDELAEDKEGVRWRNRGKLIIAKYREGLRNNTVIFHHDDRYKKIFDNPQYSSNQFPAINGKMPF